MTDSIDVVEYPKTVMFLNECFEQLGIAHMQNLIERNGPEMIANRRQDATDTQKSVISLDAQERGILHEVLATGRRRTFITLGLMGSAGVGDGLVMKHSAMTGDKNYASLVMGGLLSLVAFKSALALMAHTPSPNPFLQSFLTNGHAPDTQEAKEAALGFIKSFDDELKKLFVTTQANKPKFDDGRTM